MPARPLPISPLLPEVIRRLGETRALVLQAPPGAGKTTQVPLALLGADWLAGQKILVLEPRRLAATHAARRMASELGEPVGERVGYRVRLERRVGSAGRIEVVTYGLFLRQLQGDPALEGVGCVLFDEFHERSADSDLALALLLDSRALLRPDLAIAVMSATLDAEPIAALLEEAPLLRSAGKAYPVDTVHLPPRPHERLERHVLRAVERALGESDGDLLVFLPGLGEIRRCEALLQEASLGGEDVLITPLFGDLALEAQEAAIRPRRDGGRKVVLATAIAESSLTIEGISAVIDSGLARRSRFDPNRGMDGLVTEPASLASAEQRRGRAGRLGHGLCLRLWSPAEQSRRPTFDPAELQRCDPAPVVLQLAVWGHRDATNLKLLDPPHEASLNEGRCILQQLGALDADRRPTPHGRTLAGLGTHPRLAHLLVTAVAAGEPTLGARLAVLLSERDPLDRRELGVDLEPRLRWFGESGHSSIRRRFQLLAQQLARQIGQAITSSPLKAESHAVAAELLAMAYPDRVALARPGGQGQFLMASGRGAQLPEGDPLGNATALAIAALDGRSGNARIQAALALDPAAISRCFRARLEVRDQLGWNSQALRVDARRQRCYGALVLQEDAWPDPPAAAVRDLLVEALRAQQLRPLPWSEGSRQLQRRLNLAHRLDPDHWPHRDLSWLTAHPEAWLGDQLPGLRSFAALQGIDLVEALWQGMDWLARQRLDQLLPSRWTLPSGRSTRIDYGPEEPVLAAGLGDLFGSSQSPLLWHGQQPLTIHVLSPAGRPLQITRDLAGFWDRGYPEVRREMRGRYPRHPWPKDPRSVPARPRTKSRPASEGRGRRSS